MTAESKAKQLISKFNNSYDEESKSYILYQNVEESKRCALIAVDEVKWFHERLFYLTEGSLFDKYLDDVKQEIEKL